jgi:hypothetical protein
MLDQPSTIEKIDDPGADVKLLTIPEVAEALRMSAHTIRQSRAWQSRPGAVKVAVITEILQGRR